MAPQGVRKNVSIIQKLPNSQLFYISNDKKLVVIIALKYQKWRKFYYKKWNSFTKLQLPPEPLSRGLLPQISVLSVLCTQLNLLNPSSGKKFLFKPLKIPVQFWFQGQLFYKNSTAVLHCHSHGCSRTEASYCLYNEYGIVSHRTFAL